MLLIKGACLTTTHKPFAYKGVCAQLNDQEEVY